MIQLLKGRKHLVLYQS